MYDELMRGKLCLILIPVALAACSGDAVGNAAIKTNWGAVVGIGTHF